jgi:hypothetical protein
MCSNIIWNSSTYGVPHSIGAGNGVIGAEYDFVIIPGKLK